MIPNCCLYMQRILGVIVDYSLLFRRIVGFDDGCH